MRGRPVPVASSCITALALFACSESAAPSGYVVTSLTYAEIFEGDSVLVRAQWRNHANQPVEPKPSVQVLTPEISSVRIDEELTARPVPELAFWILGAGVGRGEVAVHNGESDTVVIVVQVFPTEFDGSISPMSAGFTDLITVTPGTIPWDGSEWVSIGGVAASWVEEQTDSVLVVRLPGLASTGAYDVSVNEQGPLDISLGGPTMAVTSVFVPNDTAPGKDITTGPFPQSFFIQLREDGPGDYYYVEPVTELRLTVSLEWISPNADLDIYPLDCITGDTLTMDAAWWYNNPEVLVDTVSAGGCRVYHFHMYRGSRDTSATAEVTFRSP